ncbi:MAG: DUF1513 domain-containing protein [Pseudomonadota bacterium]
MPSRRSFLAGGAAVLAVPSWADIGSPRLLSAAKRPDGAFALYGMDPAGRILFEQPLPSRGHAAAAHPSRAVAVAFARRPGTFALVLDCATGALLKTLESPEGRHFYGHGVFSADGTTLFTTEQDYDTATGLVGIWDADFRRVGEIRSGGIGPHEIRRLPGTDTLVVANGGIETHPDSGRVKLNIPTMEPNLSYLSPDGALLDQYRPPREARLNSIRHIDVARDSTVAFGNQWQGTANIQPLIGLHRMGEDARYPASGCYEDRAQGYIGSVAISPDGREVTATAPRGGRVFSVDLATEVLTETPETDASGVAYVGTERIFTSGQGNVIGAAARASHPVAWDNHLVPI